MRIQRLPWTVMLGLFVVSAYAQVSPLAPQRLAAQLREHAAPPVLDVRTAAEYRDGHIAGALNVPVEQLASRYGVLGLDRDREVIVYCRSGRRAARARQILQSQGYRQVRLLDGSIQAWQADHLPLVREGAPTR